VKSKAKRRNKSRTGDDRFKFSQVDRNSTRNNVLFSLFVLPVLHHFITPAFPPVFLSLWSPARRTSTPSVARVRDMKKMVRKGAQYNTIYRRCNKNK